MNTKRPLTALVCLLGGLLLADDALSQRRAGGGRSSGGRSSVSRSSGARSSGGVSRSSPSRSVSRSSPSRSVSRSSPSRSSSSVSRPSSGSYRSSSTSRTSPSPTYTYAPRTRPSTTTVRESPSVGTGSRSTLRDPGRASGSSVRYDAGPTGRADAAWRARDTATGRRDLSQPLTDSNIIDLSDAGVAPRVRFPRVIGSGPQDRRSTVVDGRSLSRTLRSRVSGEEAARMRRELGEASPVYRSRPVSRDDILSRYGGSGRARAQDAVARGVVGDARELRRRDATLPLLSDTRRGQTGMSPDERAAAARQAVADRKARRIAAARKNLSDSLRDARNRIGLERVGDPGAGNSGGGYGDGYYGDGYDDGHYDHHHYHDYCHSLFWGHHYGYGWYGYFPSYCFGYWWSSYWYYGGYWRYGYAPSFYWYGPFLPWSYSIVYQSGSYDDQEVVYVYEDDEPVEEAPAAIGEAVAPRGDEALNRAADYYLTLGDRAFRDGRYGDAVHFYAKAVEFAPEEGILYLILSDALFATGDYHYAAYALRRALELDPGLARNVVDKHSFYSDPTEFDRQLAVLERYVEDHFLDDDARLVLAANYLFGGRPAAAVDLLESPFSEAIQGSPAGRSILDAAREIQYGQVPD